MTIPILYTERLMLKPLVPEDASQIQMLYPRWEIVRYMVSSVPWPYPDNGAEHYVNNVALPDMAKGNAWFWTIRHRETGHLRDHAKPEKLWRRTLELSGSLGLCPAPQ
jgi:hypothetical protein